VIDWDVNAFYWQFSLFPLAQVTGLIVLGPAQRYGPLKFWLVWDISLFAPRFVLSLQSMITSTPLLFHSEPPKPTCEKVEKTLANTRNQNCKSCSLVNSSQTDTNLRVARLDSDSSNRASIDYSAVRQTVRTPRVHRASAGENTSSIEWKHGTQRRNDTHR
jgi:hypothetical protein